MKIKATLKLEIIFPDTKSAQTVYLALKPDNRFECKDLKLIDIIKNNNIIYIIEFLGDVTSILKIRNTADDILEHISLVTKMLDNVTKRINTTKKPTNTTG